MASLMKWTVHKTVDAFQIIVSLNGIAILVVQKLDQPGNHLAPLSLTFLKSKFSSQKLSMQSRVE